MRTLIAVVSIVGAYAQIAFADENILLGVWSGNDRASAAIYGKIQITEKQISWGGTNPHQPFCKTTYRIASKYSDTTFPGNIYPLVTGRTFTIYRIKVGPQACTDTEGYFQFAIASDNTDYAVVVTYTPDDRDSGRHSFTRISGQSK